MSFLDKQLNKLFKYLNQSKRSQPSSEWLASTRSHLSDYIKNNPKIDRHVERSNFGFWHSFVLKPATVIAIILVVALGGGTALAAQGAEPGDTLYSVKLATEDISVAITVTPKAKAKLYMKYTDRRLDELEILYERLPDNEYLQAKVNERMGLQIDKMRKVMIKIEDKVEYTDVALDFELLTEQHNQRLDALEERLEKTSAVIQDAQELNQTSRQEAFEALEQAQEIIEPYQGRHQRLRQRLNARLELLRARHELFNAQTQDHLEESKILEIMDLQGVKEPVKPEIRIYEEKVDEDGVHVESRIEIEGEDEEDVATSIEVNNGQVMTDTYIEASGETISIEETSSIDAQSNTTIRINGEELEIE